MHPIPAILYTATGLRKFRRALEVITSALDDIAADACESGLLNCYKLRKPVFVQDAFWGSSISPFSYKESRASPTPQSSMMRSAAVKDHGLSAVVRRHGLYWPVPICREQDFEFHPSQFPSFFRHPKDRALSINQDVDLISDSFGDQDLVLHLSGQGYYLSDHSHYILSCTFLPRSHTNGSISFSSTFSKHDLTPGNSGSLSLRVHIGNRVLKAGENTVTVEILDAFPGLGYEDALLALRKHPCYCCRLDF